MDTELDSPMVAPGSETAMQARPDRDPAGLLPTPVARERGAYAPRATPRALGRHHSNPSAGGRWHGHGCAITGCVRGRYDAEIGSPDEGRSRRSPPTKQTCGGSIILWDEARCNA